MPFPAPLPVYVLSPSFQPPQPGGLTRVPQPAYGPIHEGASTGAESRVIGTPSPPSLAPGILQSFPPTVLRRPFMLKY